MNLNDPVKIVLTKLGANVLNYENKEFNKLFNRELRTDYKAGDVYENLLWLIIVIFAESCEDPLKPPFTNLGKA